MSARYALYFAPPPGSLLHWLGANWHGRDPWTGEHFTPQLPPSITRERYEEIVGSARHYGFHATLKAPFSLPDETLADELVRTVDELVAARETFLAPALRVARIGGFLALTLSAPSALMNALCDAFVTGLEGLRKPETAEEVARRRSVGLTARQEHHLVRFGYPYVFEDFQFHMTLTKWLEEPELSALEAHLRLTFAPVLAMPLRVDRVALFHQPARSSPFRIRSYHVFEGAAP